MLKLSNSRIGKLNALLVLFLQERDWPFVPASHLERSFTHREVGPALAEFLASINEKHFLLRFDGDINPRSILRHGMNFLPDAEITLFSQKCVAIEVKILRDNDASGSLSKAVGQTFLYRALGFEIAIGLIIDSRSKPRRDLQETLDHLSESDPMVTFIVI